MSYNIGVIGTGYVGLVQGTCFAATGNNVFCIDIDEKKVEKMRAGVSPIFEPGLDYLLQQNLKEKRLHFSTDLETAVKECLFIFLCLPTPPNEDGSADLHHVLKVAGDIALIMKNNNITDRRVLINKSTVPVGTVDKVREIVDEKYPGNKIVVVSNPEFLREGFAVEDAMKPERIVVGTSDKEVGEMMKDLYQPFVRSGNPIIIMDEKSAEVTKYAANSFLAIKISFMNDLSAYCEKVGADIENVRYGIGSDTRIGKRFLFAGIGYGGSCFPKDVRALIYSGDEAGIDLKIIKAAHDVNEEQQIRFYNKISNRFGNKLKGKKFALWGLAFKPNTDDTREAPAFRIIEKLSEAGAIVSAYDPEAMENTRLTFGDSIEYSENMYDCLPEADALIIATEWNNFRRPDFDKIRQMLKSPLIFDGRNLFDPEAMKNINFEYHCIGRKAVIPG